MLNDNKLGFWGLTALVFGLMVGVGIYNLPQNMAKVASPATIAMGWGLTAAGILPLVLAFKWLSEQYPQYNAGIYQYAQAGFGNFAGFNIAWGYWLCTAFSNVTYGVMLNDSCGAFFPQLMMHGWETVAFGSVLIWLMYAIVVSGVHNAKIVNTLLAAVKVIMLIFIIITLFIGFRTGLFEESMWVGVTTFGDALEQVKNTMMITLFCFFGVEGAVMMSARARRPSNVGRAGIVGFFISLVLYLAVSLLCFGLLTKAQLMSLPDPSIAYILRVTMGDWAYWFVIGALVVSLLGGWVAWTLVVAQVPYEAAVVGILPKVFMLTNRRGMPAYGLMASSLVMEVFLLMVVTADDVYMAALSITGLMVIPAYFFTALFVIKKATTVRLRVMGVVIALFCVWMAYAGGAKEMLMTSLFYIMGFGFYARARKENASQKPVLTNKEKIAFALLIIASIATLFMLPSYLN